MQILLDTEALVWFLEDHPRLSTRALQAIQSAATVHVSPINFYEMANKIKIGKSIGLNRPINDAIASSQQSGFLWLPIQEHHLVAYQSVPLFDHHRDPFDRMILAIALADGLSVVSSDHNFPLYHELVSTIW
ncbi:type II toxin-antitoxin system VapC family toxin [Spirosoma soli]|uniref:Type II toxin-antitoxin system VapC family toxin n=1 Tax=Spirosoma soli TaxID=1770529 RepID=A0ABW5M915_9BACT